MSLPSRAQSDLEDRANKVLDILQLVLSANVCDEVRNMLLERIKDAMSEAGLEGVEASEFIDEVTKMLVGVLTEDEKK
tara:strand:+ start:101 stop:334 length:234 start_codon:yes stop_codon:yes gene_type:complete